MAGRGDLRPALITLAIAAVLFGWAAYAFSGAGLVRRLPLLRTGLVAIGAVYLARAGFLPLQLLIQPDLVAPFLVWSSVIVALYGAAYAIGTWLAWPALGRASPAA